VEPFLGMLMAVPFNFAPKGWVLCQGQLLPINQYQALFAVLGTTYGGDGRTTFGLPDLRSRIPVGSGQGFTLGEKGGSESVTLTMSQVPPHTHNVMATAAGASTPNPSGNVLATAAMYATGTTLTAMSPNAISAAGGSQPHPNLQPYLVVNWCIALQGIFPSQN
jgi:microcystin-dependent protein